MSSPVAPIAADQPDAVSHEMADVISAIFRMLDGNIEAVINAARAPTSTADAGLGGGPSSFLEAHAPVTLVGVHDPGLALHG